MSARPGCCVRRKLACLGMVACLVLVPGCDSRWKGQRGGLMTGAEFKALLRKAGVELEEGENLLNAEVAFCRTGRASAYVAYVLHGTGGSEFALVLDELGRVALQERGMAAPDYGEGAYFSDWDRNGTLEFVLRTDANAGRRTRVIEVAPGAPCLLEIVCPRRFPWVYYTWDNKANGLVTYRREGSEDKVTFTLRRSPLCISVNDPTGALAEGWTISGPWAKLITLMTTAPTSQGVADQVDAAKNPSVRPSDGGD